MCIGGSKPPTPKPQPPAPTQRAATPPAPYVKPEDIKDDQADDEKISTKKKKATEAEAAREGTKQFGAINPSQLPSTPSGGTNVP
tara:strand:- start:413 stop:667 length:255 start_codon:yes stop_codon:yes gene_type:complete